MTVNKNHVLSLVMQICNMQSTNCRSLNKANLAYELLKIAGINNANITEIPLDWDSQVVVIFQHNGEFKELFAGIGTDSKFYFEINLAA